MKNRKLSALFLAAALTAASISAPVSAESYPDVEKEAFAGFVNDLVTDYQTMLDSYSSDSYSPDDPVNVSADISLQAGDLGRALLGLFLGTDCSWADNLGIRYDAIIKDDTQMSILADFYINDTTIYTAEIYVDTQSLDYYFRVPALSPDYLKFNINSLSETDTEPLPDAYYDFTADPLSFYPTASELEELLNNYSTILFDNLPETYQGEEVLSVEGIEQSCTVYEAELHEKNALEMAESILQTAKEDATLRKIIENFSSLTAESENAYTDFQTSIEEALTDLAEVSEEDMTDSSYFTSKIWVDEEGQIAGRQISLNEGIDVIPLLTWKNPVDGNASATLFEIGDDISTFTILGSGTKNSSGFSGTYDILADSVGVFSLEITDETEDRKYSSFTLTPQPGMGEDIYTSIASFALKTSLESSEDLSNMTVNMEILSSGSLLAGLSLSADNQKEVSVPDMDTSQNVYDLFSEEELSDYLENLQEDPFNILLENCNAAGIPDEAMTQILNLISQSTSGGSEDIYYSEDGYYEDSYYYEEEFYS